MSEVLHRHHDPVPYSSYSIASHASYASSFADPSGELELDDMTADVLARDDPDYFHEGRFDKHASDEDLLGSPQGESGSDTDKNISPGGSIELFDDDTHQEDGRSDGADSQDQDPVLKSECVLQGDYPSDEDELLEYEPQEDSPKEDHLPDEDEIPEYEPQDDSPKEDHLPDEDADAPENNQDDELLPPPEDDDAEADFSFKSDSNDGNNEDDEAAIADYPPLPPVTMDHLNMDEQRAILRFERHQREARSHEAMAAAAQLHPEQQRASIKILLNEAHRLHIRRLRERHVGKEQIAKTNGEWARIAVCAAADLVDTAFVQRRLSCMCMFNPSLASRSYLDNDDERQGRIKRQYDLLLKLQQQASRGGGRYFFDGNAIVGLHDNSTVAADVRLHEIESNEAMIMAML